MSRARFRGHGDELSVDTFDTLQFELHASALDAPHAATKLRLILRSGRQFWRPKRCQAGLLSRSSPATPLRLGLEIAPPSLRKVPQRRLSRSPARGLRQSKLAQL